MSWVGVPSRGLPARGGPSRALPLGGAGGGGGGAGAPPTASTGLGQDDVRLWIRDRTRGRAWPIVAPVSVSCDRGKHPTGSFDVEVLTVEPWLDNSLLDIENPDYAGRMSFDLYVRDMTTPLWSGPVSQVRRIQRRNGRAIRFSCKRHFFEHLCKRRLVLTENGTKADSSNTGGLTGPADAAIAALLINHGFSGSPLTPTSYPFGVSRDDFGPSWAATCATSLGTSSTTLNAEVSDGRNVLDAALAMAEQGDCGFDFEETSAGTWLITVRDGYQVDDQTDNVILSSRFVTASEWSQDLDHETRETVLKMKGKTGNAGSGYQQDDQAVWLSDSSAIADDGVSEGNYNAPDQSATALADEIAFQLSLQANPTMAFEIAVADQRGMQFNVDYGIGSLVRTRSEAWGLEAERLVVGAKYQQQGAKRSLVVVLGNPLPSRDRAARELPLGQRGGFGAGSRFVSTRG